MFLLSQISRRNRKILCWPISIKNPASTILHFHVSVTTMELRLLELGEKDHVSTLEQRLLNLRKCLLWSLWCGLWLPGVCISIRELLGRPHWEAIRKFMCRDGVQLFHTNSAPWENSPQETASASTQPQEGLLSDYCAHMVGRRCLCHHTCLIAFCFWPSCHQDTTLQSPWTVPIGCPILHFSSCSN